MFRKSALTVSSVIIAGILLVGCGLSGGGNSGTPSGNSTPAASTSGACANPLYPVAEGVTWNYTLSGTVNDTLTRKITSVSSTGFEDLDTFGNGTTRTGKWNCDNGALIALDPAAGTSANVQVNSASADFTTTSMSGVTLPAAVNAGDTWSQSTTLEGTMTVNGKQAQAKNEFTSSCTANGSENVSVPAGNFNAMKVTCQVDMTITVTVSGATVPTTLNFTTVSWYAPGAGMVQSIGTGEGFDTTTVLTGYTVP